MTTNNPHIGFCSLLWNSIKDFSLDFLEYRLLPWQLSSDLNIIDVVTVIIEPYHKPLTRISSGEQNLIESTK
jgi:hypothetical protein